MKAPFSSHSSYKVAVNARGENLIIALPDRVLPMSQLTSPYFATPTRTTEEETGSKSETKLPKITQLVSQ